MRLSAIGQMAARSITYMELRTASSGASRHPLTGLLIVRSETGTRNALVRPPLVSVEGAKRRGRVFRFAARGGSPMDHGREEIHDATDSGARTSRNQPFTIEQHREGSTATGESRQFGFSVDIERGAS